MEHLRKKFIVDEEIGARKIEEFVERMLPFCKVTKNGGIIIERTDFTGSDKIKIALTARFLANALDSDIPSEVSADELSSSLMIPKDQVQARAKEIVDSKFASRVSKGVYKVNPFKIDDLLASLEHKYGGGE